MFKFAFRNVMRNKRRSFLTALSVFFAAMISVVSMGWVSGMMGLLFDNYVKYQSGDLRVVSEGFVKREKFVPIDETVPGSKELMERIRGLPGVASVEERTRFGLMLAWKDRTVFGFGMGLDMEKSAVNVRRMLGKQPLDQSGIIIGKGLAAKLGVRVGDKLLIATKTSEGGLNGIKLAVTGIFASGIQAFDARYFYVSMENCRRLLKLGDAATEIFVFAAPRADKALLKKNVGGFLEEGTVVQDPREVIGPSYDAFKVVGVVYDFFVCFILFMASFVVINSMMMAVYERIKEIGVLKAMGMTENRLFLNFTIEGGILGAFGGIPGCLTGLLVVWLMHSIGIDISSAMKDITIPIESFIRPSVTLPAFVFTLLASMAVPTLAAMIPAGAVRKFTAAEALRRI